MAMSVKCFSKTPVLCAAERFDELEAKIEELRRTTYAQEVRMTKLKRAFAAKKYKVSNCPSCTRSNLVQFAATYGRFLKTALL